MNPLFIPGPIELGLLVAIALLLFGYKLVPWLGRRAGQSFERIRHADDDVREGLEEADK